MKNKHILFLILSLSLLISCGKKIDSTNSSSTAHKNNSITKNTDDQNNDKESETKNTTSTETKSYTTKEASNNNDSNNSVETNTEIDQDDNSSSETTEAESKEDKTEDSNSNIEDDQTNSNPDSDKELSENTIDKNKNEEVIERKKVTMKVLSHSEIPSNVSNKINRVKEKRGYITSKDSTYQYIAISSGQRPSSGYKIKISDIYSEDSNLIIKIDEVSPAPKDNVLTVLTYPYIVIRLNETYTHITITDNQGIELKPIVFGEVM